MSLELLIQSSAETFLMVMSAALASALVGIPLGFILFMLKRHNNTKWPMLYQSLAFIVNASRSVPFIILMVAVIPFTRLIVGTSIGTRAAIIPLTLAAIPFLARLIEAALQEVSLGLIEAAESMGASAYQLMRFILWPEALPGIINALTVTTVSLVGYSAMAGAIGGGGLGDLAIRFGYQRFDAKVMLITVLILVIFVQLVQFIGDFASKYLRKRS
jgi:D-methionine transport system permease protein